MERTSLDDAVDQGEDDMSRPFSELRAEMSPEAQQRAKERTEDMLTAMTCVYCGKPVEGLREGAYIAAHTECFNKTAAAVGQPQEEEAHAYLSRLLMHCAPTCEPLPDLYGVCTQIDNLITGLRSSALSPAAREARCADEVPTRPDGEIKHD